MGSFTVYIDDSGTHPAAPVGIAAGWLASAGTWRTFSREWRKAQAEWGFRSFSAAEMMANNPESEYADPRVWNLNRKCAVCKRLSSLANELHLVGFSVGVVKDFYDAVFPLESRDALGKFPFTYAVSSMLALTERWRRERGVAEPLAYVFDSMAKGPAKPEIERIFARTAMMFDQGMTKQLGAANKKLQPGETYGSGGLLERRRAAMFPRRAANVPRRLF